MTGQLRSPWEARQASAAAVEGAAGRDGDRPCSALAPPPARRRYSRRRRPAQPGTRRPTARPPPPERAGWTALPSGAGTPIGAVDQAPPDSQAIAASGQGQRVVASARPRGRGGSRLKSTADPVVASAVSRLDPASPGSRRSARVAVDPRPIACTRAAPLTARGAVAGAPPQFPWQAHPRGRVTAAPRPDPLCVRMCDSPAWFGAVVRVRSDIAWSPRRRLDAGS